MLTEQICSKCLACQRRKSSTGPRQLPRGKISAGRPGETVGIDILGGLQPSKEGYGYVLVVKDYHSRLVAAAPMLTKSAAEVAMVFERIWITPYGPPAHAISDQGGEFDGAEFQRLLRRYLIKHRHTSAYHPQTDGLVENSNRWLADAMATTLAQRGWAQAEWPRALAGAAAALNQLPGAATKETPFY